MDDFEELAFVIPAYTPETMPLERLLQYLQQIAEVIGVAHDMHLVRIDASSTKPVFKMPSPVAHEARLNADNVRRGNGTVRQKTAYQRIRHMVWKDGGKPASLRDRQDIVILDFEPTPEPVAISGVRQLTTFDGSVIRIGGPKEYAAVLMQDLQGSIYSGFSAARPLAKEMGGLLYEPLRVSGVGSWQRTEAGEWKLEKMLIQSYERLEDDSLETVVERLRAASVNWPENADELLRAERE